MGLARESSVLVTLASVADLQNYTDRTEALDEVTWKIWGKILVCAYRQDSSETQARLICVRQI